jgi:hypothetical protein
MYIGNTTMNITTTEKNWLNQLTTHAKAAMTDLLKVRKRDYDGYEPQDVAEMRKMNKKIHEHDDTLSAIKRGILNIAGAFKK